MAVQKSKKTRSRRGMRRSHDALSTNATATLAVDPVSGERHRRHHVTEDGFYRGQKVIDTADDE